MLVRVSNTLTRQKEEFKTVHPGTVGMYVCGPTVYKPSHVGHMVGPVIFDTVKRFLTYLGYQVTFVVNITDVDDKLIVQAAKENTTVGDLAERITTDYVRNLQRLGVTSIDHMPRATKYIGEMIAFIQGLIDKGYAYPAGGDVYFDISKDADYGKLCNRDPEQLEAGARIEVSDKKRNPGDFALWKAAKPGEPKWDSPWGPGRPGWHIECSAMSMKLLGTTLDIHGGGLDLQFPHHENELAQSESYTGQTFARYWLHNGLMRIRAQSQKIKDHDGADVDAGKLEKMSKSLGNEIVVNEVFKKHEPETLRLLLLATHYRSPIEYSEDRLLEIRRSLDSFYRFFERYARITGGDFYKLTTPSRFAPFDLGSTPSEFLAEMSQLRGSFLESMADDFNTGGATGVLYETLTALNRYADTKRLEYPDPERAAVAEFQRGSVVLKEISHILGLFHERVKTSTGIAKGTSTASATSISVGRAEEGSTASAVPIETPGPANLALVKKVKEFLSGLGVGVSDESLDELLQKAVNLRTEARKAKNFALADSIRKYLGELGVTLEDRPGGTRMG